MTKHKHFIKVYNKKNAPEGAKFLCKLIERDGIIDFSVRNYDLLKSNEKIVYLYKIKK